jgi:U3 small nucleolar RNA-associated protein 16
MTDAPTVKESDNDNESPATKRRKLPVRSKEEKKEKAAEEKTAEEKNMDKEGDDDQEDKDSDDEAPEAISTVQAAAATRHSAQKASKAADK